MASPTTASTTPTSTQAHQSGATPSTASESMTTTIQALATHMLPVIQRAVDTNLSSLHRTVERLVDEAVTKRTGNHSSLPSSYPSTSFALADASNCSSRLVIATLEPVVEGVFTHSLADSTWKTYRKVQSEYLAFCSSLGAPPVPASEELLIFYVANLMLRQLAHSTIQAYLSAVRNYHIMQGVADPLASRPKLNLFMRGVKRSAKRAQDTRLPITPFVLTKILGVLKSHPSSYTNIMFWAACCLGFFAFLRSGEFTLPSGMSFNPQFHLSPDDLKVDSLDTPTQLFITIKASKTDQARKGITLCVGRTGEEICPVTAMLTYLALRGFSHGPLFVLQDGRPLFQPHFSKMLKAVVEAAGMDSKRYSGHSFRIGAATTAAAKGIADSTIQTLGRWASDSYRRYIRLQPEELASYSKILVRK